MEKGTKAEINHSAHRWHGQREMEPQRKEDLDGGEILPKAACSELKAVTCG